MSYAIYLIIIKKLTYKYHPFTFIKWLFLFGTVMTIPFGLNEALAVDYSSTFSGYTYFAIAFVILGATFGTYLLNPLGHDQALKPSTHWDIFISATICSQVPLLFLWEVTPWMALKLLQRCLYSLRVYS